MRIRLMMIVVCLIVVHSPLAAATHAAGGSGAAATSRGRKNGFAGFFSMNRFKLPFLIKREKPGAFTPVGSASTVTPPQSSAVVGGSGARVVGAIASCCEIGFVSADTTFVLKSAEKLHDAICDSSGFNLNAFDIKLPIPSTFSSDERVLITGRRVFSTAEEWIKALSLLMTAEQAQYLVSKGVDPCENPIELFKLAYFTYECYDALYKAMDEGVLLSDDIRLKKDLFDCSRELPADLPPAVKAFLATESRGVVDS